MGVFNFIETFFFISLGITFVLILLLVYHFKQRLNIIEQKNDTMFDIINNIVQEITTIKQVTTKLIHNPIQPVFLSKPIHLETTHDDVPTIAPTILTNYNEIEYNKTDSESGESESDESESESDSDESSIDDFDSDSNVEFDNDNIKNDKLERIIVSDDETEIIKSDLGNKNIKIISLNLDQELIIDSFEEPTQIEVISQIEPISQIVKLDVELKSKESIMDSYNKMSASELKAIIIQKGLSSDTDKMKKPKLLKLLENQINNMSK